MLGSALYFPHIDIDDPVWLRSAILFWDDIQTIVPNAISEPYQNEDSKICYELGYLKPLRCDLHPDLIEDLGRKVLSLGNGQYDTIGQAIQASNNSSFQSLNSIGNESAELEYMMDELVGIHTRKMSPAMRDMALRFGLSQMHHGKVAPYFRHIFRDLRMSRMHPEKMPYALRELFMEHNHYGEGNEDWLIVDSQFAGAYMSALAVELSQKLEMSPLTSSETAQGMSFRFMFNDTVDDSQTSAEGAMFNIVMRGLSVDASVPVEKLIKFREKRKDQYLEFAHELSELSKQLTQSNGVDGQEIFNQAKEAYERKIEPNLRSIKSELKLQSISSVWEGAVRALTITVPSGTVLNHFTSLPEIALLGAGAALSVADIGVRGYLAHNKLRGGNKYSYLHDVKASFGLPEFTQD
ncbi:MAG: hypothetical protein L3J04_06465 [Robiginitomaculum sp.]|nr:hypothetical protein [Robiginitomaculum sp.]